MGLGTRLIINPLDIIYIYILYCMSLQALDKGASSLEIGIIIGIASLTLTIFAPIVGYFVSTMINQMSLLYGW